jgi:hypothetical protein
MAGLVAHLQLLAPIISDNEDLICPLLRESAGTDLDGIRHLWRTYMRVAASDMDALMEELVHHADNVLDAKDHECIRNVASELNTKSVLTEEEVKVICNQYAGLFKYGQPLNAIEELLARFSRPIPEGAT